MSFSVSFRLNVRECEMLNYLTGRDNSEPSNPSELFRLLLHREFNRCKGLPAPKYNSIASDCRVGRPVVGKAVNA